MSAETLYQHKRISMPLRVIFLILVSGVFIGCTPNIQNHFPAIEKNCADQDYQAGIKVLKKNKKEYREKDQVVYQVELGMLFHLAGQFENSNKQLQSAEQRMDDLYTTSISDEASSYFSNNYALAYAGEDFERVMVNVFGAINYTFLQKWDDALVEARRVDHKLNVINSKYEKKNIYKEDAFARYLSGILYEAQGEENDAFISYRKAYGSYRTYKKDYGTPVPERLKVDLLRVSKNLGLTEEYNTYRKIFHNIKELPSGVYQDRGELVFLSYNGLSPIKVEDPLSINLPKPGGGYYVMKISFPRFRKRSNSIGYTRVSLRSSSGHVITAQTFEAENIEAIAIKNLDDRIGRIRAKAVARASAKFLATAVAQQEVSKRGGKLAGLLVGLAGNVAAAATETIDKRSWRLLPASIHMSRILAPPGTYQVTLQYYNRRGQPIGTRQLGNIDIRPGRKTFLQTRYSL
jgi:uncharacterized protein